MYDELVKKIRHCATDPMHCLSCGEDKDGRCFKRLMMQAAGAIEELQRCLDGVCSDNDALCKRIDELARMCAYRPWPEPPKEE